MIVEGKQKIWADYQKDIPDDHYFYVRSCIRQSFFPGSEVTFLDITRNKLNKDFYESAYHTTCGGIAYHSDSIPQETAMTIIARQFALMHECGYENYVCSCITSFGCYTETLETWHEFPELEAKIRQYLWSGRGTSTPSETLRVISSNVVCPMIYCTGRQARRSAIMASRLSICSGADGSTRRSLRVMPPHSVMISSAMLRASQSSL